MFEIGLLGKAIIGGIVGIGAVLWFRSKLKQAEEDRQKVIERDLYIIGLMRAKKSEESALKAAQDESNRPGDTPNGHNDPLRW